MTTFFTDSQKKAHDIQRHLSVTANAGSGKTTVLVNRYVDVIAMTDAQVGEVVAITFTDKAASELKHKIAEAIAERLRSTDDPGARAKLEQVRDRLSSAVIGTIHSFCARILREHPVESGVDAAFTVLEEIDQRSLVQQAIVETFQGALLRGHPDQRLAAVNALRALGKRKLLSVLEFLVAKRDVLKLLRSETGLYGKSDAEINRIWIKHLNEEVGHTVGSPSFNQIATTLLALGSSKDQAKGSTFVREAQSAPDFVTAAKAIGSLSELMFTGKGDFRKSFTEKDVADQSILKLVRAFREIYQSIAGFVEFEDSEDASKAHTQLISLTREIFALVDLILRSYESMKKEQSALDFDDLLIRTSGLLEKQDVRASLTARFKYLMVDEYQDTNKLQYDILQKLVTGFQSGNLFIVGDPKQSIYGFRNAEVEVFHETKDAMARSGRSLTPFSWQGATIEAREEELQGAVDLPDSFRLLRDLVAFVNVVFEPLMKREGKPFEVDYEPLVLARNNSFPGRVELLVQCTSNEKEEGATKAASGLSIECEQIARRVQSLISKGFTVYQRKSEEPRPIEYGDIAILLRSRTNLPELEKALLKHRVPYLVHGGVGFYQTQEIFDLHNYVQFLLNSENDAALAGVLRSPFFEVSDAELFEISLSNSDQVGLQSFWSKVCRHTSGAKATTQLMRAHRILTSHYQIAQRMTPFEVLKRIIDDTAWLGAISGTDRKAQNKANVEKMLSFARQFTERGFVGLYDFAERFKDLIDSREIEGQANIDSGGNSVRIMTIHAAKGLEFPAVIIPFTHRPFRYDHGPFLDVKLGLGLRATDDDESEEQKKYPIAEHLNYLSRLKTDAEEKRIFYVACTRARDLLIISGDERSMKKGPSHLRWVYEALGIESGNSRSSVDFEADIQMLERLHNGYQSRTAQHKLQIPIVSLDEEAVGSTARRLEITPEKHQVELRFDAVPAHGKGEFYSASQIQTYFDCATKFFLIYRLGVPEHFGADDRSANVPIGAEGDGNTAEDVDELSPSLQGTIAHRVLQKCSLGIPMEEVNELVYAELKKVGGFDEAVAKKTANDLSRLIWTFLSSKAAHLAFAPPDFKIEFAIQAALGHHFVTGTIDRLVKLDGTWSVLDYKTDTVSAETLDAHVQRYRRQMEMYAYLVRCLHPEQESVGCTLLFLQQPDSPQSLNFTAEDLERFSGELASVIKQIEQADDEGYSSLPRATSHCPQCGFFEQGRCLLFKYEAA